MAATTTRDPTYLNLDDLVRSIQDFTMDRHSPLRPLALQIELYESNKEQKHKTAHQKQLVLAGYVVSFLQALSSLMRDHASDIPQKYDILISVFKQTCYRHVPGNQDDFEPWPQLKGEELVNAFDMSVGISNFLEMCFDRSGMFDSISVSSALPRLNRAFILTLFPLYSDPDSVGKQEPLPSLVHALTI